MPPKPTAAPPEEPKKATAKPADSLTAALLAAQVALPQVTKDATNNFMKFNYVSAEGMIAACRSILHEQGLLAQRTGWATLPPNGSAIDYGSIVSHMKLVHVPSGQEQLDEITWPIVPEKGRPMDKAIAAALTSSLSYWLRDLLMVPREEEDGMNSRDDRGHTHEKPTQVLPPLKPKPAPDGDPEAETPPPELPNAKILKPIKSKAFPKEDPDLSPVPSKIRKKLLVLMEAADPEVTVEEIEKVAVLNGMVEEGTSFQDFDEKCLERFVANWERVLTVIESKVRS